MWLFVLVAAACATCSQCFRLNLSTCGFGEWATWRKSERVRIAGPCFPCHTHWYTLSSKYCGFVVLVLYTSMKFLSQTDAVWCRCGLVYEVLGERIGQILWNHTAPQTPLRVYGDRQGIWGHLLSKGKVYCLTLSACDANTDSRGSVCTLVYLLNTGTPCRIVLILAAI